jgi:fimbrial chaperone protein
MKGIQQSAVVGGVLACLASPLLAGGIGISPTRLSLSPQTPIATLTLSNDNNQVMIFHAQARKWRQVSGKDVYQIADNLVLSPTIFKVPPHHAQIIRVAQKHPMPQAVQTAYRIDLKEVTPRPIATPGKAPAGAQLRFLLNLSLPLFIDPPHRLERYFWTAYWLGKRTLVLTLQNTGNTLLLMRDAAVLAQGKPLAVQPKNSSHYVFPHQMKRWTIHTSGKAPIEALRIRASLNQKSSLSSVQSAQRSSVHPSLK